MLAKKHRLTKTKDVLAVFARGRAFFNPYFSLKILKNKTGKPRFTIVVSTKVSKKAVVRNRLKRIIRELIKKNMASFSEADFVFTIKPGFLQLEEREGLAKIESMIKNQKV